MTLRPTQNLDDLTGKELQFAFTKLNRRRGNWSSAVAHCWKKNSKPSAAN